LIWTTIALAATAKTKPVLMICEAFRLPENWLFQMFCELCASEGAAAGAQCGLPVSVTLHCIAC
jgi:hypothetical protein